MVRATAMPFCQVNGLEHQRERRIGGTEGRTSTHRLRARDDPAIGLSPGVVPGRPHVHTQSSKRYWAILGSIRTRSPRRITFGHFFHWQVFQAATRGGRSGLNASYGWEVRYSRTGRTCMTFGGRWLQVSCPGRVGVAIRGESTP